jgi:hypothetical protein
MPHTCPMQAGECRPQSSFASQLTTSRRDWGRGGCAEEGLLGFLACGAEEAGSDAANKHALACCSMMHTRAQSGAGCKALALLLNRVLSLSAMAASKWYRTLSWRAWHCCQFCCNNDFHLFLTGALAGAAGPKRTTAFAHTLCWS